MTNPLTFSSSASLTSRAKRTLLYDFYKLMSCLKDERNFGLGEDSVIRVDPTKGTDATYSIPYTFGEIYGQTVSVEEDVVRYISGRIPLLSNGPWSGKVRWDSRRLDVVRPGWSRYGPSLVVVIPLPDISFIERPRPYR